MILDMPCPIDGLELENQRGTNKPIDFSYLGNDEQGRVLEQHVHVEMKERLICPNGHRWEMREMFHITRKA